MRTHQAHTHTCTTRVLPGVRRSSGPCITTTNLPEKPQACMYVSFGGPQDAGAGGVATMRHRLRVQQGCHHLISSACGRLDPLSRCQRWATLRKDRGMSWPVCPHPPPRPTLRHTHANTTHPPNTSPPAAGNRAAHASSAAPCAPFAPLSPTNVPVCGGLRPDMDARVVTPQQVLDKGGLAWRSRHSTRSVDQSAGAARAAAALDAGMSRRGELQAWPKRVLSAGYSSNCSPCGRLAQPRGRAPHRHHSTPTPPPAPHNGLKKRWHHPGRAGWRAARQGVCGGWGWG